MPRTSSKNTSKTSEAKEQKIVKSIPTSENKVVVCFTRQNDSGDKYYISHNQMKENFTLWKCLEDGFEKILTSSNPMDFDKIIPYGK